MQSQYDAVILGAGINGTALARALAEQGKRVAVVEKSHIGAGASSHSSRLIHGGLRYLENFEFSLVREALSDQHYLLQNYPELVKLRNFYLPVYESSPRPAWMLRAGLWLYGFFSRHGQKARRVPKEEFLSRCPALKAEGLKAVFCYADAKTDDYALTCAIAAEAKALGVEILEEEEIKSIAIGTEKITVSLAERFLTTSLLVNATGAWADEVNARFSLPSSYRVEKLSGIHLVIDRVLVPEPIFLQTAGNRIFFVIPEKETTLIGTTERSESADVDAIEVNDEDIEYLLKESNNYLKNALKRSDIKEVFIGIRPLIKSAKDPSQMSREYKLDLHKMGKNRVMHIYGGKLTTFPSLAKRAAELLRD